VACISTDTADYGGREVSLLRAVVLAMTNLTTILASLVLVISESTVQCSKFTKLVALQLVLAFWDGCSLGRVRIVSQGRYIVSPTYSFDNIVDQLLGFVDLVFGVRHDQAVQIFVKVAGVSSVRLALAFFDRAFATNGDLGARLGLHLFECVTTRA
jgi:hypothetical protein